MYLTKKQKKAISAYTRNVGAIVLALFFCINVAPVNDVPKQFITSEPLQTKREDVGVI